MNLKELLGEEVAKQMYQATRRPAPAKSAVRVVKVKRQPVVVEEQGRGRGWHQARSQQRLADWEKTWNGEL